VLHVPVLFSCLLQGADIKISLKHTAIKNVTINTHVVHLPQHCHNSKIAISVWKKKFKSFEVLQFSMSATTTQLLSSGEFCKLRYDTIPVKSASTNVSFCTNKPKMPNFEL
jgi:hypothetical protein